MPEVGSPFRVGKRQKLTDEELVRAIGFMVAAEYEAIQLYMQLAESTDNKLATEVLEDIADEERVHAGEFLRLLRELSQMKRSSMPKGHKKWKKKSRNEVREPQNTASQRVQVMDSVPRISLLHSWTSDLVPRISLLHS